MTRPPRTSTPSERPPGWRWLAMMRIAGMIALANTAVAHQPFESSAMLRLDGDRVELVVTTSIEIAGLLIDHPTSDPGVLSPFQQTLTQRAASLYEVKSAGVAVAAERSFFSIRAGEAVFSAIYPIQRPAGLEFRAAYLDQLPIGYAGLIEAYDEAENPMADRTMLRRAHPTFSLRTPALAGEAPPAATPPSAAITPPTHPRWQLLALAAVLGIPLSLFLIRQSRSSPKPT